jgi:bilirubin oxidase
VAAGSTWLTNTFTIKNQAATYWYHPHMHGTTQKQLTLGAGGFIIVKDAEEAALNLPRTYGTDDIPLMLTSRRFTTTNGVANQFQYTTTAYGDYMLTNGTMNAEVTLPKQYVRLRILNGETERDYNLGFSDNRSFYVIGNDGGLLNAPVAVTRLIMAPGERYEIMVNLAGEAIGTTLDLKSFNGPDSGLSFGYAGLENATSGEFGSLLNYTTFTVLHINVGAATANAVTALPPTLANNVYLTAADATKTRTLNITATGPGAPFTFDGLGYNMDRIDQAVTTGATEAWTVSAGTIFSHSFHIHGVQFKIVARNGQASEVKSYEQGWKDTIYLPIRESLTFVARFNETASASYPFMYHCHMTNHEDGGLMGQFTVSSTQTASTLGATITALLKSDICRTDRGSRGSARVASNRSRLTDSDAWLKPISRAIAIPRGGLQNGF